MPVSFDAVFCAVFAIRFGFSFQKRVSLIITREYPKCIRIGSVSSQGTKLV